MFVEVNIFVLLLITKMKNLQGTLVREQPNLLYHFYKLCLKYFFNLHS